MLDPKTQLIGSVWREWLRVIIAALDSSSMALAGNLSSFPGQASFTGTLSGPYASPLTGQINYRVIGPIVVLTAPFAITGNTTATASVINLTGLPPQIVPFSTVLQSGWCVVEDNTVSCLGQYQVTSGGITLFNGAVSGAHIIGTTFTASGTSTGIPNSWTVWYTLG